MMTDRYLSLRCVIPADLEELLPELLAPWGILGTEIGDSTEQGVRATVFLHFDDADRTEGVRRVLLQHGACAVEVGELEADDWLAEFRDRARPFEVGKMWWIDPHPGDPTAAPTPRHRLVIEPRMAFGTGTHESTRLMLMEIEELDIEGRTVLDVGTGSGILAFAAERVGARSVVGLDIDPTSIWVAREIARQQEWAVSVNFILGPVGCVSGTAFDIVLCNMIVSNFLPLVDDLRGLVGPHGCVIFSGLMRGEMDRVSRLLASSGLEVISSRLLGDWASLTTAAGSTA